MMNKNDCCNLKKVIDMASFAMDDVRLYLDTHPDDADALAYYEKYKHIREHALEDYSEQCGPMCSYQVKPCNYWTWNMGPWPWELEG